MVCPTDIAASAESLLAQERARRLVHRPANLIERLIGGERTFALPKG